MTFEEFSKALNYDHPDLNWNNYLIALWYDAKGNWDKAHQIAQSQGGKNGAWIHAYLHRKEGDTGNASFWYGRAGAKMPSSSLQEEWEELVKHFLN